MEARVGITVPDNLAVARRDDVPASRHPASPLTTVREAMTPSGTRRIQLQDRLTTHRTVPLHELLPTELVSRSSCG